MKDICTMKRKEKSCFELHDEKYSNPPFRNLAGRKYKKHLIELDSGKKTVYSASIHYPPSMKKAAYDRHSSEENFTYYMEHAN